MTIIDKSNLSRALGLLQGMLLIEEMKEFNKEGLLRKLKEVEGILTEVLEN